MTWQLRGLSLQLPVSRRVQLKESGMTDAVNLNTGKSEAEVAHTLLTQIATLEGKFYSDFGNCDRAYVLDTYAECLKAARGLRRNT